MRSIGNRAVWFAACILFVFFCAPSLRAQVNTATVSGTVLDPQGLAVRGVKVTVTNPVTDAVRESVTDDTGRYNLVGLPPGKYVLKVDSTSSFAAYEDDGLILTVGANATFDPHLQLIGVVQSVMVSSEATNVETSKTEVSQTIEQRRIDNLPINGRNYINFTLTNSQTTRDVSPTIGPAPNSGLNVSGARARGNMVSVDGADAVDNSVNGIRSTVSQEAVQEFQLILSNYNAEYGRASGGVINIVTKSGGNDFHGDAFGYFRNKAFQSRNAFSGEVDPTTGDLEPVKQAYTRVQTGATLGGALKKDKTFYFFSYEYTQREETGFSSIGQDGFGVQPYNFAFFPASPLYLTPAQDAAVNTLLGEGQVSAAANYAVLLGSASSVALNKFDYGAVAAGQTGGLLNPGPGAQFPLPVTCPFGPGQIIGTVNCTPGHAAQIGPTAGYGVATLPTSYVGLNDIRGNFPIGEKTSLWSGRVDQRWSDRNSSFLRVGVSPSLITGIESTSQNQVAGQNSASRTGVSQYRDLNFTFQHDTIVSPTAFNEFRMQVARRGLHFGYSDAPGGSDIGVNIPGYAYFGREPYSPVDRIERRFEFTDNLSLVRGRHTFKVGVDANVVQLRSSKSQIFQLDFGGDVNFGGISASTFGFPDSLPGATALQAYGLGIPTSYIQGIGQSNEPFDNLPFGFFGQDSWRVNRKLTINYGLRYDVEISPLFAPATAINAAAEPALGVTEGIRRNTKDFSPRIGIAWDPKGDGKTVIRAGYGIFYDHPLLAVAFDAVTADGGRSVQLLSSGGTASACGLITVACGGGLDTPANLNGSSIFQGALNANALPNLGYEPNQQRFNPLLSGSLFANQNYLTTGFPLPILPFTLPVGSDFHYAYANQANLTIEREIAGSWKISVGYQYTRGVHLNRPVDINSTNPQLLDQNALNAAESGIAVTNPVTVIVPTGTGVPNTCLSTGTAGAPASVFLIAPGALAQGFPGSANCSTPSIGYIGTPAFFNFFRPSGPNPSFAQSLVPGNLQAGYAEQVALAGLAGFPTGFGVPVPFNSVDAQESTGSSWYDALTVNLTKRFTKTFELLSSYTWSHSIDDSTDLQSTLEPQDSRFPQLEKSNSDNDQRHRWVTSAVFQSPAGKSGDGFVRRFLGDVTLAPIVELSSGRPFNVITGEDTRLDLGSSQARPSVVAGTSGTTSPYIKGVSFVEANVCLTATGATYSVPGFTTAGAGCIGNLSRNAFTTPGFFQWDMRVSKRVPIGERLRLDLIADAFNLFNRTNVAAVNQLCDPSAGTTCTAGQPTAASDPRQFQFALKLTW